MNSSTISRYRESSSVTSPIKIYDPNNSSFAEDCALEAIGKEAELRLQHQREQNREARQIRCQELEKSTRDENDEEDVSTIPLSSSTKTGINTTDSLFFQKFVNGDVDLRTIEPRDLRRLLSEFETKYKSLMITNSSIYNEKQALHCQIEAYKDILDEHYESFNQAKRQLKEKCRDFDLQKQILIASEENNDRLKEILLNCKTLIEKSTAEESEVNESIDEKLKRLLNEKHDQYEEIIQLKSQFEEEKHRSTILKEQIPNVIDIHHENLDHACDFEQHKQLIREINDSKNRLQKFEADNGSLQQENKRYEVQLARYKQQLDDAEHAEDELKQERRRLQRELRSARDELENERTRSDVLQRENTRLRTLRQKNLLNHPDSELLLLTSHLNDIELTSPLEDSI